MKQLFYTFALLVLVLMICSQIVNACSISFARLRKEFRNAKSVFVGKLVKIDDYYIPTEKKRETIPEEDYWKDKNIFSKVSFEILNKWKGETENRQNFIAVAYFSCGCPGDFSKFKAGEEYLIFARGKDFVTVCEAEKTEYPETKEKMKRLNSFWFRTWARIFPF